MENSSKKKFFTSRNSSDQKRENSPSGKDRRKLKRAKRVYEFDQSTANNSSLNSSSSSSSNASTDSGLEDVSSSIYFDDSDYMSINMNTAQLNLNQSLTPKRKALTQRSPNAVYTSTPNKKSRPHKTDEKVDLWEQAMQDDPKLREYISKFNEEIKQVTESELIVKEIE